jgi:hypothetical protein
MYLYKIIMKPLVIALSGVGRESRGRDGSSNLTMYHIILFRTVTVNPLYNNYTLIKILRLLRSLTCYS